MRKQTYSKSPVQNEERALPGGPKWGGGNVSRIPPGLEKGQMFQGEAGIGTNKDVGLPHERKAEIRSGHLCG